MRIPYQIHTYFYSLEPIYTLKDRGAIEIREVRLYAKDGSYKGIWFWPTILSELRLHIRAEIKAYEKEKSKHERLNAVHTRTKIANTK